MDQEHPLSSKLLPWPVGRDSRDSSQAGPAPTGRARGWRSYWPALLLLGLGFAALPLDLPLARLARDRSYPSHLYQLVDAAEPFGHGIGAAFVLTAIFLIDPRRRRALPRVALMSIGAGLASNLVKMLVHRSRPAHFDFAGGVFDTFKQFSPFAWHTTGGQSCPSSHTATAMGLTLALAWLYPAGRWLFVSITVLVASQRVMNSAHFLSDVCWGATLGWLMATACLRGAGLFRHLDHWEGRDLSGEGELRLATPAEAGEKRRAA